MQAVGKLGKSSYMRQVTCTCRLRSMLPYASMIRLSEQAPTKTKQKIKRQESFHKSKSKGHTGNVAFISIWPLKVYGLKFAVDLPSIAFKSRKTLIIVHSGQWKLSFTPIISIALEDCSSSRSRVQGSKSGGASKRIQTLEGHCNSIYGILL